MDTQKVSNQWRRYGGGQFDVAFDNYVKTLNILPQKTSDVLNPLKVNRKTIHAVPKYEIQIRWKTGENCSSLRVKTFLLFLVLTL